MRRSRLSIVLLACALSLASCVVHAQPQTATGIVQNLSGTWDFHWDPTGSGEQDGWPAVTGHPGWTPLHVPGSPNFELAAHPDTPEITDSNLFYRGSMWYHLSFQSTPDDRLDSVLHLAAVALRNKVWINGHLAGASAVPYQDVAYDISHWLRAAGNDLVIEVDNRVLPRAIPDEKWVGWWDAGGLLGPVTLERRPLAHSSSFVTTTMLPNNRWKLSLSTAAQRDPAATATRLFYTLTDDQGRTVWKSARTLTNIAGTQIAVSAELSGIRAWSPEHPALYRLTVTTLGHNSKDIDTIRVGFRQVETHGSQIWLNGKPIVLRGFNRHQFLAGQGMTLTAAQNRADLADIKSLGANFVRLTHYSQAQDVYDACDELGLLVWTEIPAWATSADTLGDPSVWQNDAMPQLDAMVKQHRNHPSVIIYSVANEIQSDKASGAAYVQKAIAYVRSLDSSRLITFASNKAERDLALGYGDIVAVNEYFGWYYGKLGDVAPMLDRMHAKYPGKPIVVSEYGSEAVPGWDPSTARPDANGVVQDYSTAYQAEFLTAHMQAIYAPERSSYMAGGAIWVYNDFPDPHRVGGSQPLSAQYRNCKGVVTMDRKRKPAYDTVKLFYHQLAAQAASGVQTPPVRH